MIMFLDLALTLLGGVLSFVGWSISKDIRRLTISVDDLNVKMAVVIEKIQSHERRIQSLEKRKR